MWPGILIPVAGIGLGILTGLWAPSQKRETMNNQSTPCNENLWERLENEDTAPYKDLFFSDCLEWGPEVAIYNLGFLVGWDDRNEQD